jgi:hypothetical protein
VGAHIHLDEAVSLLLAGALQVAQQEANYFIMQGNQLKDAHRLVQGIEREADRPGDAPLFAGDQVAGAPGLERPWRRGL